MRLDSSRQIQTLLVILVLGCVSARISYGDDKNTYSAKFSRVEIEPKFREILTANPLLMEVTGAKIIKLPQGRTMIVAVASTVLKDNSATQLLKAEKVCKTKALASVVSETEGVQVAHQELLDEKVIIVFDGENERSEELSKYVRTTRIVAKGHAKGMIVVGKWYSKDGEVLYLAMATILDKNGETVHDERNP